MMVFWTDPFGKRWSSDRFLREFGLSIGESARVILEAESQRPSNVLLQAYCRFDDRGDIESIAFHGRIVLDDENTAFHEEIAKHADWTDEQVIDAMSRREIKFGPTAAEQLKRRFPSAFDLEPLFGGSVDVHSVIF